MQQGPGAASLRLSEINSHLMCVLCRGYLVDATTIVECLHTFCRSCLVCHLERVAACPTCEAPLHKARPFLHIRSDKTLQDIVYKLVPGLYRSEMQRRRNFFSQHPDLVSQASAEERGVAMERLVFSPEDHFSLSLEYFAPQSDKDTGVRAEDWECASSRSSESGLDTTEGGPAKRYLQCPALFTVGLLKKFLRMKFELENKHKMDVMHRRVCLPDDYTLMDVAYIYSWRQGSPMRFFYRIYCEEEEVLPSRKRLHVNETVTVEAPPTKLDRIEEKENKCSQNISDNKVEAGDDALSEKKVEVKTDVVPSPISCPSRALSQRSTTPTVSKVLPDAVKPPIDPNTTSVAPSVTASVAPSVTASVAPSVSTSVAPSASTSVAPSASSNVAPSASTIVAPSASTSFATSAVPSVVPIAITSSVPLVPNVKISETQDTKSTTPKPAPPTLKPPEKATIQPSKSSPTPPTTSQKPSFSPDSVMTPSVPTVPATKPSPQSSPLSPNKSRSRPAGTGRSPAAPSILSIAQTLARKQQAKQQQELMGKSDLTEKLKLETSRANELLKPMQKSQQELKENKDKYKPIQPKPERVEMRPNPSIPNHQLPKLSPATQSQKRSYSSPQQQQKPIHTNASDKMKSTHSVKKEENIKKPKIQEDILRQTLSKSHSKSPPKQLSAARTRPSPPYINTLSPFAPMHRPNPHPIRIPAPPKQQRPSSLSSSSPSPSPPADMLGSPGGRGHVDMGSSMYQGAAAAAAATMFLKQQLELDLQSRFLHSYGAPSEWSHAMHAHNFMTPTEWLHAGSTESVKRLEGLMKSLGRVGAAGAMFPYRPATPNTAAAAAAAAASVAHAQGSAK